MALPGVRTSQKELDNNHHRIIIQKTANPAYYGAVSVAGRRSFS
jgi:hypothetical protein